MSELFDVVDENGNPTGETEEREIVHRYGTRHRTAHVWILRETDKGTEVLLQKRSANKDSYPGLYDTSSAGHVIAGDAPIVSAIRELHEELGINATIENLNYIGSYKINNSMKFHGKPFRDNEVVFVYVYTKPVDINELTLQEEEVERVDWFLVDDVIKEKEKGNDIFCMAKDGLKVLENYIENKKE